MVLLATQHIFLMSSTLVLPVVLISELGGSPEQVRTVVALTMISCGIGTILQAMRGYGIGSGFLCPNLCGPNFFAVSAQSAWLGGLPLMRGMTVIAGLIEIVFARIIHRLEFLFPSEITGMVVLMVGVGLVPLGVSKFLGVNFHGEPIQGTNFFVAAVILLLMAGINVWSQRKLKLYAVLIGMTFGYLLSYLTGLLSGPQFHEAMAVPWLAWPALKGMWDFAFSWSLLPTFAIVSITGALKSFGNLILCEKVNDDDWREPDMTRVSGGLVADGLCVTLSGLLGGMASDTSASNVSLSSASGATSRVLGFAAGGLFILLGFSPKLSALLSIMPAPVMGAILVFVVSFMIMSGLQIILSTKADVRRTFVIGISLVFGLSLEVLPDLYARVDPWLRPFFESSLTFSTVLAVLLNQVLRIGSVAPKPAVPIE
jgi:xanthine permease XanP